MKTQIKTLAIALGVLAVTTTFTPQAFAARPGVLEDAEKIATNKDAKAAIGAYGDVIHAGMDSAEIRYNLGTLYLEDGVTARAIFHLKTALLWDPLHEDARHNLATAIRTRADSVSAVETTGTSWIAIGRRIPPGPVAIATGLLALLFGIAFGLRALVGGAPLRRVTSVVTVVVGMLLAVSTGAFATRWYSDTIVDAVVLDDEVVARLGPSDDAKESFVAHAGLVGAIVEERDHHARLRLDNGLEAWISVVALARIDGSQTLP